jgi:hypothetical protein
MRSGNRKASGPRSIASVTDFGSEKEFARGVLIRHRHAIATQVPVMLVDRLISSCAGQLIVAAPSCESGQTATPSRPSPHGGEENLKLQNSSRAAQKL